MMPAGSFHSFFNDNQSKDGALSSVVDDLHPATEVNSLAMSGARGHSRSPDCLLDGTWPCEGSQQHQVQSLEIISGHGKVTA